MYKTCNWLIDQLNTFMYICWVSPGRPSSVQCPGFTKLEHDLDIQFFNPERLHTAVQTRKNAGNFCVLDADAVRSERVEWPLDERDHCQCYYWPVTNIHQCPATKLKIESLPRLNAEVSPTLNDSGECWGCNKSVPSKYSRENIYLVNFPLLHRGSSGRTPTINCGVYVTTQSLCWCWCSDTTNYIMLDILGLTTRIRIFGIQIHLQNMIRSTTTNKVTC